MRKGTYKGPIEHLVGKTALLNRSYGSIIEAQFDDIHATLSGHWPQVWVEEPHSCFGGWWENSDTPPLDSLGYRWTAFPVEHWDIDE